MNVYTNMLGGYRDRVARIALFDVFHHLENKLQKDDAGRPIDTFGIGLLSVLFFFEHMLLRKKKTGIRELGQYLAEATKGQYKLDSDGYNKLARSIVETLRPSNGKGLKRSFFNYETGEMDELTYGILRADEWDPETNIQYYTLDEQGLELIFATKEYFSEFQISISQLVLRKQLEKGEFIGALRQVDEMRINVHTIRDRMVKIRHEIQRNIISDDTYERYRETIDDINRRLQQEHQEFEELVTFIHETKHRLDGQLGHSEKDTEALEMVVRIDNELAHVHFLHANLLKESIELKTTAIEAAGESLYYAGVTSFNFEQAITRKLIGSPLPFETSKTLSAPFLSLEHYQTWSLVTVFEKQALDRPERHVKNDFLEVDNSEQDDDLELRQQVNSLLMKAIIDGAKKPDYIELDDVLETDNLIFGTREFCDLWIVLHQQSPMMIDEVIGQEDHIFNHAFKQHLSNYKTIEVIELSGEVSVKGNYTMKRMAMILGGTEA